MTACTCGADGLPPGPHESFCALVIGDRQAREETAEALATVVFTAPADDPWANVPPLTWPDRGAA